MTAPTYPASSDVSAGQPTAADQYNNLRLDALTLGAAAADAASLGTFLSRYIDGVRIEYLATDRLRVQNVTTRPATLMINGFMCQAAASVDLPASSFSGAAATWYVFARRSAGSRTFTLEVNTSSAEGADQRIIGEVAWDGTHLVPASIRNYARAWLEDADYDTGWFSVAYNQTYTKAHGLGVAPRLVMLLHAAVAAPGAGDEVVWVTNGYGYSLIGWDGTNIYDRTYNDASSGCCYSTRRCSGGGYHKILAWR